jgi:hypothetical protein
MRYWIYCEPVSETSSEAIYQIYSDRAILDTYWDYWSSAMRAVGRESQISENNCITDWAATHWAWPADSESLQKIIQAPNGQ